MRDPENQEIRKAHDTLMAGSRGGEEMTSETWKKLKTYPLYKRLSLLYTIKKLEWHKYTVYDISDGNVQAICPSSFRGIAFLQDGSIHLAGKGIRSSMRLKFK